MSSSPQLSDAPEVKSSQQDGKTPDSEEPKIVEDKGEINAGDSVNEKEEAGEEEEEEEGECGFCLFMKGGGCKESFIGWENCIEEAEKKNEDIVEKCFEVTTALKKCMEAHSDYYEPILHAEKRAEEEAVNELQREKQAKTSSEEDQQVDSKNPE
ncbi:uncharacterized protein LOC124923787 [Impatiens glandulifera]|uniref:uncharacterized protein LOC124923787 n=1 Tax=Impatiens glandulifera TaxID=253017 RepID=UPI001FB119B3|nr:uncharacterized protein LOC124923787 [Impatiens glandulifera]